LAADFIENWLNFPTAPLDLSTIRKAVNLCQRFQISYWDAAIIAAAHELGCRTIFSEDLSHGQNYDGVTVLNPFAVES
jgi:predicted nucleic acid-binding protein